MGRLGEGDWLGEFTMDSSGVYINSVVIIRTHAVRKCVVCEHWYISIMCKYKQTNKKNQTNQLSTPLPKYLVLILLHPLEISPISSSLTPSLDYPSSHPTIVDLGC